MGCRGPKVQILSPRPFKEVMGLEVGLSISALAVSFLALAMSYLGFRFEWTKPFDLRCLIKAVIWQPAPGGRTDAPFSLLLSVVFQNKGAVNGVIDAAYIDLVPVDNPKNLRFRLDAFMLVDVNEVLLKSGKSDEEQRSAIRGLGSTVYLSKYEAKDLGILFSFPPIDAKRYQSFGKPSLLKEQTGKFNVELACCVKDVWAVYDIYKALDMTVYASVSKPTIFINGGIFDKAPGAISNS